MSKSQDYYSALKIQILPCDPQNNENVTCEND